MPLGKWAVRLATLVVAALSCGCMMDASKLAGFSKPKLAMSVDAARGKFDMEAGTDFEGKARGYRNPDTGEIEAEIEIGSSVSPVVQAEGERAEALVELRKIEAQMLVKMHELVGDNIKAAGTIVSDVAKAAVKINEADERSDARNPVTEFVWSVVKAAVGVLILLVLWVMIRGVWDYARARKKPTPPPGPTQ